MIETANIKKLVIKFVFLFLYFFILSSHADETRTFEINSFSKAEGRKFVDHTITAFMQKYDIPGLSIAIARNGEFIFARGYGYAHVNRTEPVTPAHQFRIASLSKPITAVAIMALVDDGKLALDDKVFGPGGILSIPYPRSNKYIKDITIRHLLEHTAAPEWTNDQQDPMFREVKRDKTSLVQWVLKERILEGPPGTQHAYSNFGYCVLGLVIETITGQSYNDYVKTKLFKPINANSFAIAGNRPGASPLEVTYYPDTDEDPYWFPIKRMDAHGGWIANAMDVVRFVMSTDGFSPPADLLSLDAIKAMITPSALNPHYALGWNVNQYNNWWYIGSLPGTASVLVRTSHGYSWAVLTNKRSAHRNFLGELDQLTWKLIQGAEH